MSERPNQRIAYFNGDFVPESHVPAPFRERGFRWGDSAFDSERTVAGKPFRLQEHIDRLDRSLRYLQIEIGETPRRAMDGYKALPGFDFERQYLRFPDPVP